MKGYRKRLGNTWWSRVAVLLLVVFPIMITAAQAIEPSLIAELFARLQKDGHVPGPEAPWEYPAEGTYLIIAADAFCSPDSDASKVKTLAEWKRRKGYYVVESVLSSLPHSGDYVSSADVLEHIRTIYNKEGRFSGIPDLRYIALVGECDGEKTYLGAASIISIPSHLQKEAEFYTDSPYVESLDRNNPGPYYEFDGAVVGRISVSTVSECATVIGKIMRYDRTPDTGSWYNDVLAAGFFEDHKQYKDGKLVPPPDGYDDGAGALDTTTTIWLNLVRYCGYRDRMKDNRLLVAGIPYERSTFTAYHFVRGGSRPSRCRIQKHAWASMGGKGKSGMPDPVPGWVCDRMLKADKAAGAEVTKGINGALTGDGVGLVFFRGHGNPTGWSRFRYQADQVDALHNGVKTPVVFSMTCSTGAFYHPKEHICFCERMLRRESGGCVGIIGASHGSDGTYGITSTFGMFTALFGPAFDPQPFSYPKSGVDPMDYPISLRPAEALICGKAWMRRCAQAKEMGAFSDAACHRSWNLHQWFGDPEMMLRTQKLILLDVKHSYSLPKHGGDFAVTVATAKNEPVAGARVAVTPLDEELRAKPMARPWVGYTKADGSITLALPERSTGSYALTITAENAQPYEALLH